LLFLFLPLIAVGATVEEQWLGWLAPALRDVGRREIAARQELAALGAPVVGQTAPQFGYQHRRLDAPPPSPPWIQVDLGASQPLDWIALVPARLDWQSAEPAAHAFPPRFRVDISDDPTFAAFKPVAVLTETDFPDPGLAPVVFQVGGEPARYVRVTVSKLAVENGQYFFALAELMVLAGPRNVALGRSVSASTAFTVPPRWSLANLVDGRTPLGPPVRRELLPYDGLYAELPGKMAQPWMRLDLGRRRALQEVRLHPIHARLGADVPGHAFPTRFRVEASDDPAFAQPIVLLDASAADYPNPGNNPVTLSLADVSARYVQVVALAPAAAMQSRRFGLSEIEVYADGVNVARTATVTAAPDPAALSRDWPLQQLVDGFTSYGRLLELPAWLAAWQRRVALEAELGALARERARLALTARRRAATLGAGTVFAGLAGLVFYLIALRRGRRRELERLRTRLAHDLHDEIGSNLAGLGVLSETAADGAPPDSPARNDWLEVNRIARETTEVMREVLWLVGARQEMGIDLPTQLRLAATRLLPGRVVHWSGGDELWPTTWTAEDRRQVFLFFKETLANVVRHAAASEVRISLQVTEKIFELKVTDNGCGFDLERARRGVGLSSLRERARVLGGHCAIEAAPGRGATVVLCVPVASTSRARAVRSAL
jgi:signal transduction histidine kinase